ncbi:MAG: nitric oxide reductase activation protein NorD [Nitrospiria bacterium]
MDEDFESYNRKLNEISPKAARAFMEIGAELWQELSFPEYQVWFNLGALISYSSSANGIRYFNESAQIVRRIAPNPAFIPLLQTGIRLVMSQNSMALDYFRQLPNLVNAIPHDVITPWAEVGRRLAEEEYLTGSEYFKAGPSILPVIEPALLESWGKVGLLLSKADSQNKTFHALEFFRTTPTIFSKVKEASLHADILKIGHALALQTPNETNAYFKEIPELFKNLQKADGIHLIFSLTTELAFHAPGSVTDFLAHATDLLKMMNGNLISLKRFVETGLQMKSNPDSIKSFFNLKSKKSIERIQELTQTVFLTEIKKRLTYYAEMITGHAVEITPGLLPASNLKNGMGSIILPEKIHVFKEKENNYQLYKLLLLHEAAHIEFGSYEPIARSEFDAIDSLFPDRRIPSAANLQAWLHFPDPTLAQNLWTIAEESRIDFLLRSEYPGAVRELKPIFETQKNARPDLFNLPEEKAVIEALFQLSVHEDIVVPLAIANTVSRIFNILKTLWHSGSSVKETLYAVCLMYQQIQKEIKPHPPGDKKPDVIPFDENLLRYGSIPQSAFSHHGLITPELAFQTESAAHSSSSHLNLMGNKPDTADSNETFNLKTSEEAPTGVRTSKSNSVDEKSFYYSEWDWMSQDYKPGWCKVVEKDPESSPEEHRNRDISRGSLLSLRRYFEKLRPQNYKKSKMEKDGEDIDFDRVPDLIADIQAGTTPSENIYIRREKKERKISVSFLVDLSGSTSRIIPGTDKRIIDIERESLNLMAEALDSIGDDYGIFGFSGQSRQEVAFYTLKDFDEKFGPHNRDKVDSLEPLKQNRDGAAIRHLIEKLNQREARIKLLIVMSDGKPLDDDYTDLYSLEDTKMALREAKQKGIHPFCITVDQQCNEYIKEMYRDVNFTFISDIQTLPLKLPQIYKKITT